MIKSGTQYSYFEKKPKKQMSRLQNNPSIFPSKLGIQTPEASRGQAPPCRHGWLVFGPFYPHFIIEVSHFILACSVGQFWIMPKFILFCGRVGQVENVRQLLKNFRGYEVSLEIRYLISREQGFVFFPPILGRHTGNHPQEELIKFGHIEKESRKELRIMPIGYIWWLHQQNKFLKI